MQKRLPFIILGLLLSFSVAGQRGLDSFKNKLSHTSSSSDSIVLMNSIAKAYLNTQIQKNERTAIAYYDEAILMAERIKDEKALLHTTVTESVFMFITGKKQLKNEEQEFLNKAEQLKDKSEEAYIYTQFGSYYRLMDSSLSKIKYNKAIELYAQLKDSVGMAKCWSGLAEINLRHNNYEKANQYFLQVLNVFENNRHDFNLEIYIGYTYLRIGNINYILGDYDKALDYFLNAEKVEEQVGAVKYIAEISINIGQTYAIKNDFGKALFYYEAAYEELKINYDEPYMASCLCTIGNLYSKMNDQRKASEYLGKALQLAEHLKETRIKCIDLSSIADGYLNIKNYNKAIAILQEVIPIATEFDYTLILMESYTTMANAYARLGDYKSAFIYQNKQFEIKDSLFNQEKSKQIAEMQSKYEAEKNGKEILLLNKNNEVMQEKISRKNLSIVALVSGSLLVILLLSLLLNRRILINRNKYAKELNAQQQQMALSIISAQEEERQKIAKDIHDSLGAYLSSLKINLDVLKPTIPEDKTQVYQNSITSLGKVTEEMRAIAKNLVSDTLREYGLVIAIEELAEIINQTGKIRIDFNTNNTTMRYPQDLEICVFRIVQELLNNTIKHSKATTINLVLEETNERVSIMFSDNGTGFNQNSLADGKKGLGLKNMEARAKIFKGTFVIDSKIGGGSVFKIDIPNFAV